MWRKIARAVLALAVVLLAGASVSAARRVVIAGRVSGVSLEAMLAGHSALVSVSALVRCNGFAAATARDGTFHLTLPPASQYACQVIPPAAYLPASATLGDPAGDVMTLRFGLLGTHGCVADEATAAYRCGALALRNVPAGNYGCVATGPAQQQAYLPVGVRPAETASANYTLCQLSCPPMRYHDGQIMHAFHAYLIFWLPAHDRYDDATSDDTFEAAIGQYFRDVGGSSFASLLTQYWDFQGPAAGDAALGGVAVDTSPYQHCPSGAPCQQAGATTADPLYDVDVQAEVARVMRAHKWTGGLGNEFFVFLADGAQECQDSSAGAMCTYAMNNQAFCGYHSWFQPYDSATPVIYATIADAGTASDTCIAPLVSASAVSPNGDWLLDAEISVVSHEQFESVTDPVPTDQNTGGWFDGSGHAADSAVAEIGDRCQRTYGNIRTDGSNVTLGGHKYLLQAEWSNAAGACELP